jgi:uncharacterized Zn-binding protein involved in type VI secretion
MPGAVRLSDSCTGHGCWPSRVNDTASGDVFANSRGAHRTGDHWVTHCCTAPPFPCHDSSQVTGSPNVFVNGRAWARIGDAVACGSSNATGSGNVIVNG